MNLKKNIFSNFIGRIWTALIALAFIPVYINYLGIEAFALVSIFTSLIACISLLDGGMSVSIGREMSRFSAGDKDKESILNLLRTFELISIFLGCVAFFLIWLSSDFLANDWLKIQNLTIDSVVRVFLIIAFIIGLSFLRNIYRASIVGLNEQLSLNKFEIVLSTIQAFGAILILKFISPTIEAFFIWQAVCYVLITLGFYFLLRNILGIKYHHKPIIFSAAEFKSVWKFSSEMMAVSLLGLIISQADKVILSKLLPLSEFGYYSVALTVVSLIVMLTQPIDQATYPVMTKLYSHKSLVKLESFYHQSSKIVNSIVSGVSVLFIFFGFEIVFLWTSSYELATHIYDVMPILVVGSMMNAFMHRPYYLQLASGHSSLLLKANLLLAIFMPVAVVYGSMEYGAKGAATTWVIVNFYYLVGVVHFMHKKILQHAKWKWYLSDLLFPLSIAFFVGAALKQFISFSTNNIISALLVMLIAFVIISSSLLTSKDIRNFLASIMHYKKE